MLKRYLFATATICLALVAIVPGADAQITLRFDPGDTTIALGENLRLSIMLDDVQDVRSFEVWLQYDPDILTYEGGERGQLFADLGCTLFPGATQDTLGTLHGFVVILGADCWTTGPGELFHWDFTAAGTGTSPVDVENLAIFAPQSGEIENVTLAGVSISVADAATDVPGLDITGQILGQCHPNPFNPTTTIDFKIEEPSQVSLGVYSLDGRLVSVLVDEFLPAGDFTTSWNGRDRQGRLSGSGTYFYTMKAGELFTTRRMTLLK